MKSSIRLLSACFLGAAICTCAPLQLLGAAFAQDAPPAEPPQEVPEPAQSTSAAPAAPGPRGESRAKSTWEATAPAVAPAAGNKDKLKGWADDVGPTGSITVTRHINKARELSEKYPFYAKQHYMQAIELSPKSIEFPIEYYQLCWKTKDWKNVAAALEKVFALNPAKEKDYYANYGYALAQAGDFDKAATALKKALAFGKERALVHEGLLRVYLGKANREGATREYRETLRLKPGDAELHAEFASYLWNARQLGEAVTHYRAVARLKPADAPTQAALGYALMQSQDYGGAYLAYRRAAEIDPANGGYRDAMNQAYQYQQVAAKINAKKKKK